MCKHSCEYLHFECSRNLVKPISNINALQVCVCVCVCVYVCVCMFVSMTGAWR